MNRTERYPNFFIIGAPRAGTTALSEYLRFHPNVFLSDPKEPQYFATDFPKRLIWREKDYLKLFGCVDPKKHLAVGEASAIYLFSSNAVLNILRFNPSARLIAMIRNPVDLVISLHGFLVLRGVETITNFWEAWEAENKRKAGSTPYGPHNPQMYWYSEWGRLGRQLQRLLSIVPHNQLKIILFDDFISDTRKVYLDVLSFLGLPDDGRDSFPVVNERRRPKYYFLQRVFGILETWWLPMKVYITGGRGLGIGRKILSIISAPILRGDGEVPTEVRNYLIDFYREEIYLLEDLLNRDLKHWVYKELGV